jgi:hypothetical protein
MAAREHRRRAPAARGGEFGRAADRRANATDAPVLASGPLDEEDLSPSIVTASMLPGDVYKVVGFLPRMALRLNEPSRACPSHPMPASDATSCCGRSARVTSHPAAPPAFGASNTAPRDQ